MAAAEIKTCCAALYQSDWAQLLLGDSFHPGGLTLTERLGTLLNIGPDARVLDAASGRGTSAIHLAREFGCRVDGVDFSADLVRDSTQAAAAAQISNLVRFHQGDAESLPFGRDSFDVILTECAFCTFPDKFQAAREFRRVLKPGGRLGISDLTRAGDLDPDLDSLLAWVACIADARPLGQTQEILAAAGFDVVQIERHNYALKEVIRSIQTRLIGAEILLKLDMIPSLGVDLDQAKRVARAASQAVERDTLGYALLVAKPQERQ